MGGHLVEVARSFKALVPTREDILTQRNKKRTLLRLEGGLNVMTAVLGTLPFVATLWLLVVLGAKVLEESGGKIAAALRGEPVRQVGTVQAGRQRHRQVQPRARAARSSLRAAA